MIDGKLKAMRSLRNALCEAIAAIEAGREAVVEFRCKPSDEYQRCRFIHAGEYRCVRKPREAFVTCFPHGQWYSIHRTYAEAERIAANHAGGLSIVRFVEPTDASP